MFCLLLPWAAVATALALEVDAALEDEPAASDAALVFDLHPNRASATAAPVTSVFIFVPGIVVLPLAESG
jgi:hypothetical protein